MISSSVDSPELEQVRRRVLLALFVALAVALHTVEVLLNRKEVQRGGILTLHVPVITPCEFCGGTGRTGFFACLMCGGSGETAWQIPVSFSIPPGVTRGTMLKIPFETKHGKTHLLKVLIDVELFW